MFHGEWGFSDHVTIEIERETNIIYSETGKTICHFNVIGYDVRWTVRRIYFVFRALWLFSLVVTKELWVDGNCSIASRKICSYHSFFVMNGVNMSWICTLYDPTCMSFIMPLKCSTFFLGHVNSYSIRDKLISICLHVGIHVWRRHLSETSLVIQCSGSVVCSKCVWSVWWRQR
jgi:hypothetical protein